MSIDDGEVTAAMNYNVIDKHTERDSLQDLIPNGIRPGWVATSNLVTAFLLVTGQFVDLAGLAPAPSSLSEIDSCGPCYPALLDRERRPRPAGLSVTATIQSLPGMPRPDLRRLGSGAQAEVDTSSVSVR
jgi:hypothetical protein